VIGLWGSGFASLHRARNVAATIQANADAFGADLIVSGAFGYTRLREWFFGGVTRSFLDHSPVCCLMSH
jgi:nucleotide-binding universal stress UspA family protein